MSKELVEKIARVLDESENESPMDMLNALMINTCGVASLHYRGMKDFITDYIEVFDKMMNFLTQAGHPAFKLSFLATIFLNIAMNEKHFPYHLFSQEFVESAKCKMDQAMDSIKKATAAKMN